MEQQQHTQEINDTKIYTGEDIYDYTFPIQYQGHVCNNIYQTLLQLIDDIMQIDTKYVDYQTFDSLQDRVQNDETADTLIIQDGDQMIHVYSLKMGTQKINTMIAQIEQIITDIEKLKIETVKIMTAQEFQEHLAQQEPDQQDTIILNNIYIKSGQFVNTLPGDVQKIKQGCKRLILQNVTFNSGVTMQNLFANCSYIECIEVQCLYVVQSTGYYFQNTFQNCTNLKQIRFPNIRVVDCYNAFYSMIPGCSNLRMIYTPCLNDIDVHDQYNKLYLYGDAYGDASSTSDGILYFVLAYTFSNNEYMFEDVNQYTQQVITLDQYQVYSILDKSKEEQEHGSEDEFMKLIDKQKYQITIGQQTSFYNLKDVTQALNTNKLSTGNYTINNVDQSIISHIGDLYNNKVETSAYQQDMQTITQTLNNKVNTSTYNNKVSELNVNIQSLQTSKLDSSVYNDKMSDLDNQVLDLQTNKLSTGNYTINNVDQSITSHIGDIYSNKVEISTYQQDLQTVTQALNTKTDKLRVQGSNNQPYDIQIYGMDTWGYDCYELVTPDSDSYILGFTEQIEQTKTYSIFGDNVSYVFYLNDTIQQYKLVVDESTEIQLTKNGENSYSGDGYSLVLYDEHTTYIEDAIQKINIVLGTVLTELKTDRLQMFSPEISANAGLWHSMIDKMQNDIVLKANSNDVYDKVTMNGFLGNKANTSDVYNKTYINGIVDQMNTALASKANVKNVYDKTETYNQTEINNALNLKANTSDVYAKTDTYNQTEVDTALNLKANSNNVYDKTTMDGLLGDKANTSDVYVKTDTYNQTEVDTALALKANTNDVYNRTYIDGVVQQVNTALGNVYTKKQVNEITGIVSSHYINQPDTGYTAQTNLQDQLNAIMGLLGIGYTEGVDNRISIQNQTDLKSILTYLDKYLISGVQSDNIYSKQFKVFTSQYKYATDTVYNIKDAINYSQWGIQQLTEALNELTEQEVFKYTSPSTKGTYTGTKIINTRLNNINTELGKIMDELINLNYSNTTVRDMTVSDFLTYFNNLPVQNGVVYVKNINLTSGNFQKTDNCIHYLPANCSKIIFQNFQTACPLQFMFYKNNSTNVNLELEFDFNNLDLTNALQDAFSTDPNSSGTTIYKITFPNITTINGENCFREPFDNMGTGIYQMTLSFPKLITISGTQYTTRWSFGNENNSGTYTLNLSMPELTTIQQSGTGTDVSAVLLACMFKNVGTYTINRLYLPKLVNLIQAVNITTFATDIFAGQSNKWICLNNNLFQLSNGQIQLKYKYNTSTSATYNTGIYYKKQINLGDCSLLYFTNSSSSYLLTKTDYQKLQYYPEIVGELTGLINDIHISQTKGNLNYLVGTILEQAQSSTTIYIDNFHVKSSYTTYNFDLPWELSRIGSEFTIHFRNFTSSVPLSFLFSERSGASNLTLNIYFDDMEEITQPYLFYKAFQQIQQDQHANKTYNIYFPQLRVIRADYAFYYAFHTYNCGGSYTVNITCIMLTDVYGLKALYACFANESSNCTYNLSLNAQSLYQCIGDNVCQYAIYSTAGNYQNIDIDLHSLQKVQGQTQDCIASQYYSKGSIKLNNNFFQNTSNILYLYYYPYTSIKSQYNTQQTITSTTSGSGYKTLVLTR